MENPGSPTPAFAVTSSKLPFPKIPEQVIRSERRDIEIDVAVVVVVRRGDAHAIHLDRQAGLPRDVGERPVAIVVVQRRIRRWSRVTGPVRRVDEEDVLPSVVVDVDERGAGAQRLGQVLLAERAAVVAEVDASRLRDVREGDRRACRRQRGRGQNATQGEERWIATGAGLKGIMVTRKRNRGNILPYGWSEGFALRAD